MEIEKKLLSGFLLIHHYFVCMLLGIEDNPVSHLIIPVLSDLIIIIRLSYLTVLLIKLLYLPF